MDKLQLTLADFLMQESQGLPDGNALTDLLCMIADTCVTISGLTSRGVLAEVTGKLESRNIQGETQMKLDVMTNDLFIAALKRCGLVAGLASEEMDAPMTIEQHAQVTINQHAQAKFLVVFDPLDGSSNVPVNVSVGSIFSILNAAPGRAPCDEDYLQSGRNQIAAGYAIYGPATMLVLTIGKGTHGFTLNPDDEIFYLTHRNLQIPEITSEFAINASNERFWEPPAQRYVDECKAGVKGPRGRDFNMRWVASMVADVHRILVRGGVYLYPRDNKQPVKEGRLRLMYEANPMSMLVEQAGGKGSTGRQSILDIVPEQVHQRVPVILGSSQEVDLIERYYRDFDNGNTQNGHSPLFGERSLYQKAQ